MLLVYNTRKQLELLKKLIKKHIKEAARLGLSHSKALFERILNDIEEILRNELNPSETVWIELADRMHQAAKEACRERVQD